MFCDFVTLVHLVVSFNVLKAVQTGGSGNSFPMLAGKMTVPSGRQASCSSIVTGPPQPWFPPNAPTCLPAWESVDKWTGFRFRTRSSNVPLPFDGDLLLSAPCPLIHTAATTVTTAGKLGLFSPMYAFAKDDRALAAMGRFL